MEAHPIGAYRCINKREVRNNKYIVSLRNCARNETGSMVLELPADIADLFVFGEELVFYVEKVVHSNDPTIRPLQP